jgi:hypothetical protein
MLALKNTDRTSGQDGVHDEDRDETGRTVNKSKLPAPLNDTSLEIAEKNVRDKFSKDFVFVNPATGD